MPMEQLSRPAGRQGGVRRETPGRWPRPASGDPGGGRRQRQRSADRWLLTAAARALLVDLKGQLRPEPGPCRSVTTSTPNRLDAGSWYGQPEEGSRLVGEGCHFIDHRLLVARPGSAGRAGSLQAEGITDALALLDESRMNLAQSRVRLVNQLHALLRDLLDGGTPTDLSATTAAAAAPGSSIRRRRTGPKADRRPGWSGQIPSVDTLLKSNARQVSELVAASGSTLTGTVGIGAITAGRLIGRTGRASRFPALPHSSTTPERRPSR